MKIARVNSPSFGNVYATRTLADVPAAKRALRDIMEDIRRISNGNDVVLGVKVVKQKTIKDFTNTRLSFHSFVFPRAALYPGDEMVKDLGVYTVDFEEVIGVVVSKSSSLRAYKKGFLPFMFADIKRFHDFFIADLRQALKYFKSLNG